MARGKLCWSTVCVFYWIGWARAGTFEVAAIWIIGLYLLMDLAQGFFFGGVGSGVAYFAHVGGGGSGVLLCIALRARRDTVEVSEAKAVQADVGDLSEAPLHVLAVMAAEDPGNPEILRAMVRPSIGLQNRSALDEAMAKAGPALIDKDCRLVAEYLTRLGGSATLYRPTHLLRLAGMAERVGNREQALGVYQLVLETYPQDPEVEMAHYRMATMRWENYGDVEGARNHLREMARQFPNGAMFPYARELWKKLG